MWRHFKCFWLHNFFLRYLSCGAWAGKLFCFVMIIDLLLWHLLQLWQVSLVLLYTHFSFLVSTVLSFLEQSLVLISLASRGYRGGAWFYTTMWWRLSTRAWDDWFSYSNYFWYVNSQTSVDIMKAKVLQWILFSTYLNK